MNFKVWKITDEDFVEVAQFVEEGDACMFAALAGMLETQYVVTKANETPVW